MITVLLVSALAMGFLGSAHCLVMCGGVVGVLCAGIPAEARARPGRHFGYLVAYNLGRLLAYSAGGAVAGAVGVAVDRAGGVYGAQVGLRMLAGLVAVVMGLYLAGAWPRVAVIERLGAPIWRRVEPLTRRLLPVSSARGALLLGVLWGLMPCGLVYGGLGLAVSSGAPWSGALVMLAFGAGTVPALLVAGAAAGALSRWARRLWVRRAAGGLVIVFGAMNLVTASAQARWSPGLTVLPGHECCAAAH